MNLATLELSNSSVLPPSPTLSLNIKRRTTCLSTPPSGADELHRITSPALSLRCEIIWFELNNFLSVLLPYFRDVQCISGKCRVYPGNRSMCAGDRVEAVTALDILYNDFHRRVYGLLNSSSEKHSCGMNYTCPDGEHLCQTR